MMATASPGRSGAGLIKEGRSSQAPVHWPEPRPLYRRLALGPPSTVDSFESVHLALSFQGQTNMLRPPAPFRGIADMP